MEKTKKNEYKIPCALLGTKVCPRPHECNGINRKCTIWKTHSAK